MNIERAYINYKFGINIILLILNSNVWGQNSNSLTLTIPQKRGL